MLLDQDPVRRSCAGALARRRDTTPPQLGLDDEEEGSGARGGNSERRSEDAPRRTQLGSGCRGVPLGQQHLEKALMHALPKSTPHKISQMQHFLVSPEVSKEKAAWGPGHGVTGDRWCQAMLPPPHCRAWSLQRARPSAGPRTGPQGQSLRFCISEHISDCN